MDLASNFSPSEVLTLSKYYSKDQLKELASKPFPGFVCDALVSELKQLIMMSPNSHESVNSRRYVQYLLALPWLKHEFNRVSIESTRKLLNQYHYGRKRQILCVIDTSSQVCYPDPYKRFW